MERPQKRTRKARARYVKVAQDAVPPAAVRCIAFRAELADCIDFNLFRDLLCVRNGQTPAKPPVPDWVIRKTHKELAADWPDAAAEGMASVTEHTMLPRFDSDADRHLFGMWRERHW